MKASTVGGVPDWQWSHPAHPSASTCSAERRCRCAGLLLDIACPGNGREYRSPWPGLILSSHPARGRGRGR